MPFAVAVVVADAVADAYADADAVADGPSEARRAAFFCTWGVTSPLTGCQIKLSISIDARIRLLSCEGMHACGWIRLLF